MNLTIAPLSVSGNITKISYDKIINSNNLFLQTKLHPSSKFIIENNLKFTDMDDLFESSEDFDELNASIAERLTKETTCDCVYAVPGRGIGKAQYDAIKAECVKKGIELITLPSTGYAESACATANISLSQPYTIISASDLTEKFDRKKLLCIEEIDTLMRASEVKLMLEEYYPSEYEVIYCTTDENGIYSSHTIKLYELDRLMGSYGYFASSVLLVPAISFDEISRYDFDDLIYLINRLRAPDGCPWDREQTHESLIDSLIEEAYEVIDAIKKQDVDSLCEELGDLLLHIVFHTVIENELCEFNMMDVTTGIVSKMIYRHPHVFSNIKLNSSQEVLASWEELKMKEKHQETITEAMRSVPECFPALLRSHKVQKKAAKVGFDFPDAKESLSKVYEEADEVKSALEGNGNIEEELGDLLFACVNTARLAGFKSELLLSEATDKFISRFEKLENSVISDGKSLEKLSINELDMYWNSIKHNK